MKQYDFLKSCKVLSLGKMLNWQVLDPTIPENQMQLCKIICAISSHSIKI